MNSLKELIASAADMGETLHTTTVARFFNGQSFMGEWQIESHC